MSQPAQLTGAQTVYSIQELLEEILSHLSPPSLLTALRATRLINEAFTSNKALRLRFDQILFRKAVPRHTWLYYVQLTRTRSGVSTYYPRLFYQPQDRSGERGVIAKWYAQLAKLHPYLPRQCPPKSGIAPTHTICDLHLPVLQSLPAARIDDFLTQPPCTSVRILAPPGAHWDRPTRHITRLEGVWFRELLGEVQASVGVGQGWVFTLDHVVEEADSAVRQARTAEEESLQAIEEMPGDDVLK